MDQFPVSKWGAYSPRGHVLAAFGAQAGYPERELSRPGLPSHLTAVLKSFDVERGPGRHCQEQEPLL